MPRPLVALPAGTLLTLAAVTLAGCTSETQVCKDGICTLRLKGANATATLGGDGGSPITLLSASGDTAKIKLGRTPGTLRLRQPITLSNATLELTEVKGEDSVTLKLRASGSAESGSTSPATGPN